MYINNAQNTQIIILLSVLCVHIFIILVKYRERLRYIVNNKNEGYPIYKFMEIIYVYSENQVKMTTHKINCLHF